MLVYVGAGYGKDSGVSLESFQVAVLQVTEQLGVNRLFTYLQVAVGIELADINAVGLLHLVVQHTVKLVQHMGLPGLARILAQQHLISR
ncbi:hypothetical protein D3C76_1658110 [compost metagenome]